MPGSAVTRPSPVGGRVGVGRGHDVHLGPVHLPHAYDGRGRRRRSRRVNARTATSTLWRTASRSLVGWRPGRLGQVQGRERTATGSPWRSVNAISTESCVSWKANTRLLAVVRV